ncbi:hypothetical protein DSM106972_053960 [Dulcicalothrix desertica PCC 7102]|uniref:Uncharacterized protein n=1 Tax=Dulcicalothrix desertica PCC 7102 TaxID=232991 RepID=A0A3S1CI11_9CYAN|nr:hypothetical protein DSM106972_053960 [Dulcicalothrix desertica PCC 7102]
MTKVYIVPFNPPIYLPIYIYEEVEEIVRMLTLIVLYNAKLLLFNEDYKKCYALSTTSDLAP